MHVMQTWRAFFDETSSDSANVKKESNNKREEKQKV